MKRARPPAPPAAPPNTLNRFAVGAGGEFFGTVPGQIVILNLPLNARRSDQVEGTAMPHWPVPAPLTADEAINLAAWLVALSGKRAEFLELLEAVMRT